MCVDALSPPKNKGREGEEKGGEWRADFFGPLSVCTIISARPVPRVPLSLSLPVIFRARAFPNTQTSFLFFFYFGIY